MQQAREMLRLLILSFILNFIGKSVLAELALAIVGGHVQLTASQICPDSGNFELTTGKEPYKTLARRVDGLWSAAPGGPFIGRVVHNSSSSLILTNLNFKHSGHVVFVCDGKDFNTVELKVLAPHITKVTEADTAVLCCYSLTADQVKWFKEGGKIRVRDAFYEEVISEEDETCPGSYPLTLENVQQEDRGIYFCCPESCDAPMAFEVIVDPRPNQITSPPSHHPNTTQSPNEGNEMRPREIFAWALVAVLGAAVIVLVILLFWQRKKGRKSKGSPEKTGNGNATEMKRLRSRNNHTDAHANNHNSH